MSEQFELDKFLNLVHDGITTDEVRNLILRAYETGYNEGWTDGCADEHNRQLGSEY